MATIWQTPRFTELSMNAEIGSYQADFDQEESPPHAEEESEETSVLPAATQGA